MGSNTPDLALIFGDTHLGEDDPSAIAALLASIARLQPGIIVCNGDVLDCCELHKSQLGKRAVQIPHRSELTIEQEIDLGKQFLGAIRAAAPSARIAFCEGNHEMRWGRVIRGSLPHLASLTPSLPTLLGLDDLRIEWIPHGRGWKGIHGWTILHGTRCSLHAGKLTQQEWGGSTIQGHSHRLKMYSLTYGDGVVHYAIERGHLHTREASYTPREIPDWQKGFVLLTRVKRRLWLPHLIPIVDGTAVLPGQKIRGLPCQ